MMSLLSYGVKVIVMVVERPADIRPDGVYYIRKKSLMESARGRSLKELKENETFVIKMVCVCGTPTVKSLKKMVSGFEIKETPLNSLPATICGLVIPSFYLWRALAIYSSSNLESFGKYS